MQQKNEATGNLQEKFWLYECAKCDKGFPYLYSFKDLSNMYHTLSEDKVSPKKGYKLFMGTSIKPKTSPIQCCAPFGSS